MEYRVGDKLESVIDNNIDLRFPQHLYKVIIADHEKNYYVLENMINQSRDSYARQNLDTFFRKTPGN